MSFFKLIRYPNLLIVALSQYIIQYKLLVSHFNQVNLFPSLDFFHFTLLVIATILMAAAGYIINDLVDYEIDLINKPQKVFINKTISQNRAWQSYWGLNLIGFGLSLYLAIHVQNIPLVLMFPIGASLLYIYSVYLKKECFIGNLIVAFFCAFVPALVLFAERSSLMLLYQKDMNLGIFVLGISIGYVVFAFLSTMFREIIKDIEDIAGDIKEGCRTLPIVYGVAFAKIVAAFFGITLLTCLSYWLSVRWEQASFLNLAYLLVALICPLVYALICLAKAKEKENFGNLSLISKLIMLSGLIYLFV